MNTVCILGLGYIGLPTACMFAAHGLHVLGVDIDDRVVQVLSRGDIHLEEVGLQALYRECLALGTLRVSCAPAPADAFVIAVPTPIHPDKTADLRAVIAATESIVSCLRPGNLVVLESTSPPRTVTDLVRPILEQSGLKAGQDFWLVYSPERVLPGQILKEMIENSRVIGGINRASAEAGRELYATFVKGEIILTDSTTAEMVKLMENTFRDVNIALANEFALIAEELGISVWEAIELANHHPRVTILRPGPGVGGHCIAVDPWFLVEAASKQARLIRQARLVNDGMPEHVVGMVRRVLAGKRKIAVLGLTFKADVDDTRESPALEVARCLIAAGLDVRAFDPHVRDLPALEGHLVASVDDAVRGADAALILVDHAEFKLLTPNRLAQMEGTVVIDTRNCLDAPAWRNHGFDVVTLGAPILLHDEHNSEYSLSVEG